MENLLDSYSEVRECDYKGEHYSVRDNGAVMRHPKPGKKARPNDNEWTFGTRDEKTAYMKFGTHRIHIIVANAFLGEHDSKIYVVDHIDTNRCNNRVSNLRWFTRLENALNNPITRKRIEWLCGGDIQKFIDDPSCLRTEGTKAQDLSWMRTVTPEEAKTAMANLMRWAKKAPSPVQGGQGADREKDPEWMFKPQPWSQRTPSPEESVLANVAPVRLENVEAKARRDDTEFLLEPDSENATIEEYFGRLTPGAVFARNRYGESKVIQALMSQDKSSIGVAVTFPSELKNFAAYKIFSVNGQFFHQFLHTCFEENGALQRMTEAAGETWTGPDSIDNYC